MASAHMNQLREWFPEKEHHAWYRGFTEAQKDQMLDDDLSAGYRIPAILTAIVVFGQFSMIVSVLFAW